ncbi:TetR/AcrR family transcriptional regulator [Roseibium sp.]|uniref:TetR/AcrR family transcriptional regulator n=1 Tax=Roseibium sp. TaxID=1936156 RepID=UPI003A983E91
MELFWDRGYDGTSMADLADATGMAKPGLYATFGDKEHIFQQALCRYDEVMARPMIEELLSSSAPLRASLRASLSGILHSIKGSGLPMGCFILNSTFECSNDEPAIKQHLVELNLQRRNAFRQRLLRGRDEGELPGTADIDALANYFAGQSAAIGVMARAGLPLDELEAMVDVALNVLPEAETPSAPR